MLNTNVEWRNVVDFEDRYQVSNTGLVRSIQDNHGNVRYHIKAQNTSATSDYMYVKLFRKDKLYNRSVHRLVAVAFLEKPDGKEVVNHKDGNKRNNNADNLEWLTTSENHKHAFAIGLRTGERAAMRLLGKKYGSASKYHNVSWDSSRNRWLASVKRNAKVLFQKRFSDEREAAIYVNKMLDLYGITDRPRNNVS